MKPKLPSPVGDLKPLWFAGIVLGTGLIVLAMFAGPIWRAFVAQFSPMTRHESHCLICNRGRVEETLCGQPTVDRVRTTEGSDWIDTFVPTEHEHVWAVGTSYYRGRWFSSQSIGCGGVCVLPTIFRRRTELGEETSQQLVLKFHDLVRAKAGFKEFYKFAEMVEGNPEHLLNQK